MSAAEGSLKLPLPSLDAFQASGPAVISSNPDVMSIFDRLQAANFSFVNGESAIIQEAVEVFRRDRECLGISRSRKTCTYVFLVASQIDLTAMRWELKAVSAVD